MFYKKVIEIQLFKSTNLRSKGLGLDAGFSTNYWCDLSELQMLSESVP